MALYSKAQEILWTHPPLLDGKLAMRVGGMHLTMAFISSIGHFYSEAGLLALLTESDTYAHGTAHKMLTAKHYS